jgi:hypothetical protein
MSHQSQATCDGTGIFHVPLLILQINLILLVMQLYLFVYKQFPFEIIDDVTVYACV